MGHSWLRRILLWFGGLCGCTPDAAGSEDIEACSNWLFILLLVFPPPKEPRLDSTQSTILLSRAFSLEDNFMTQPNLVRRCFVPGDCTVPPCYTWAFGLVNTNLTIAQKQQRLALHQIPDFLLSLPVGILNVSPIRTVE